MKLVARYTLLLGTTLALVLAVLAYARMQYVRADIEDDMRRDHRMVGHVLAVSIANIWHDAPTREHAANDTQTLLARANSDTPTRFEWVPGDIAAETQAIEGPDFVSRFPVGDLGTLVARESLADLEHTVRTHVWFNLAGFITIIVVGLLASLLMGRWLVGRPIGLLIQQTRRIGRRELSNPIVLQRGDELGELALELRIASETLAESLARTAAESEARIAATEALRHSERLSTVGKLAAGVAHELGTPLSIVGGHAQMIAAGEVTGDAALASARAIDRETTRMSKIVRQLLDFARRKGPEGTTCDPAVVAERCVDLLRVMAERARVAVSTRVEGTMPRALIDEDSLQQVLTNLIVNAIQAMPGGGTVQVDLGTADGRIRVAVTDTGPGIPPPVVAHVFEPFFTTKPPGEGTGLGLAVVHGIVVDHGGEISIATGSTGTTFTVYLQEASS